MDRYQQQVIVPGIGPDGQQKLRAARVLVVGAGGLGVPLSTYLAAAGVGTIGIIDGDSISLSNLHRQFSYHEQQVGESKALVLQSTLARQNPSVQVLAYNELLSDDNAGSLIIQYDIICDCSDNATTRMLIDRICGVQDKPLVYAGVREWEGQVTVLRHTKKISLANVFTIDTFLSKTNINCAVSGVVGTTCGVAATLQTTEVLKIIVGMDSELDGGILCFDLRRPVFRIFKFNE